MVRAAMNAGAATALLKATQLDPANASANFNCGVTLMKMGNLPEAIVAYKATLKLDPARIDA